ncbi:MAG: hypothetical protein AVDCRST_MAG59-2306, partial [uncultured Thermomicrobiales bacterium]
GRGRRVPGRAGRWPRARRGARRRGPDPHRLRAPPAASPSPPRSDV